MLYPLIGWAYFLLLDLFVTINGRDIQLRNPLTTSPKKTKKNKDNLVIFIYFWVSFWLHIGSTLKIWQMSSYNDSFGWVTTIAIYAKLQCICETSEVRKCNRKRLLCQICHHSPLMERCPTSGSARRGSVLKMRYHI
jgi:hypothetical protein